MVRVVLIILAFLALFPVYFLSVIHFYPQLDMSGQFGDMFGGLNAVFSGLAFMGVIYAILLQRKELELQRKELELTRAELKRAAEAQELSQRALSKQADSLKATAKLNGLSSLLQRYTSLRNDATLHLNQVQASMWDNKANVVMADIENIINSKYAT